MSNSDRRSRGRLLTAVTLAWVWHSIALGLALCAPVLLRPELEWRIQHFNSYVLLTRFVLWLGTALSALGPTPLVLAPCAVFALGYAYCVSGRGRASLNRNPVRHLIVHLLVGLLWQLWFLLLILALVLPRSSGYVLPL